MEPCPDMPHRELERQMDLIAKVVSRHRQQVFERNKQEFEAKMKEKDDKIRELQRQLDEQQ